jgi:hypothetical protein
MLTTLSDAVVERWRLLREEAGADAEWVAQHQQLDARRRVIQREILELVKRYLAGEVDTERFRETFDRKTRHEWEGFGFKGMSGAMFLNMLVKHIPDQDALESQLKGILNAPLDPDVARRAMEEFLRFLDRWISSGQVAKRQIQPARVSFFVPLWWHLRVTEQWPIFYPMSRKAFELEGIYSPTLDPVGDYFTFRDCFSPLASALELKSWELEHLCAWHDRKHSGSVAPVAPGQEVEEADEEEPPEDATAAVTHTHVQWLLAKLGHSLGCRVWIAANDRSKEWNGERLGDLSLPSLPSLGMDHESQRLIERIDVLWLKGGKQIAAAFEVEHTTSIYSGLLRMSDLIALAPNLNFPLYIVTSEGRLDQVRRQLSRPTFQALDLHKRCGFFSDKKLLHESDAMLRFASDPSAIEKLASKVEDVSGGPGSSRGLAPR